MLSSPFPQVYACHEQGAVSVPITDLVIDGRVEIFPEVRDEGYFDIDYRRGELVLRAKNYIGLIPINNRVSIHVIPLLPIKNILYIVQKARRSLNYLPGYYRTYAIDPTPSGDIDELFLSALIDSLKAIETSGLLRRYIPKRLDGLRSGRVLMSQTVTQHIARGDRLHLTIEKFIFSYDVIENRIVKNTLVSLLRRVERKGDPKLRGKIKQVRYYLGFFDGVSDIPHMPQDLNQIQQRIKALPGSHKLYENILWLCSLLSG